MKKNLIAIVKVSLLLLFVLLPAGIYAATINVPSAMAPTIQAGINLAVPGDVVLVANGIYSGLGNSDIDFMGKAITVKSVGGAANCTIDASPGLRGFWFHRGETAASVVAGFTITKGNAGIAEGGGILCEFISSPTIQDCVITGNSAAAGGGIACSNASPKILNCVIENNASMGSGGGIACDLGATPTITNCSINKNTATMDGAGIAMDWASSPIVSNCQLTLNNAGTNGGGIGIGINSKPTIVNCVIASNTSALTGGGIASSFAAATVTNCTITGNQSGRGGGIKTESSRDVYTNCIFWGDLPNEIRVSIGGLTINYSDIQGGYAGIANMMVDPKFVNPLILDFHLTAGSPVINMGSNTAPALPATDKDGKARILGGIVDMGAYEF